MELRQTCMRIGSILGIGIITLGSAGATSRAERAVEQGLPVTLAKARTCKQVSSCAEAVALWCGGYRRADADNDGIPCENVCATKELVDELRQQIGC